MRNVLVLAIFVAVVIGVILWRRATERRHVPADEHVVLVMTGSAAVPASAETPPADAALAVPSRVRKLEPGERERFAAQIARARANPTPGSASPPALAGAIDGPDQVLAAMLAATAEIKPFMVECHAAETARRGAPVSAIRAALTLAGDADVGALIDTSELTDGDGKPLSPAFAECLRETLRSLALPPVVDGKGHIE